MGNTLPHAKASGVAIDTTGSKPMNFMNDVLLYFIIFFNSSTAGFALHSTVMKQPTPILQENWLFNVLDSRGSKWFRRFLIYVGTNARQQPM